MRSPLMGKFNTLFIQIILNKTMRPTSTQLVSKTILVLCSFLCWDRKGAKSLKSILQWKCWANDWTHAKTSKNLKKEFDYFISVAHYWLTLLTDHGLHWQMTPNKVWKQSFQQWERFKILNIVLDQSKRWHSCSINETYCT